MKYHLQLLALLCFASFALKAQEIVAKASDTTKQIILATYYAKKFEGRKTTSGERYRAKKFTAAHRSLPFGTIIKVKNLVSGKTVEVKVNDRGPFNRKFSLDISQGAAKALGIYKLGYARVEIAYVKPD
ncbi:septal ring lytic transglycosylase RlpA family protein [Pedobacter sp. KR3-3]|uniref:Probable endolytic peptidoglycan transglycosylase RlpA n=1 Tax=Pedobacter albus TaxID=3113905 RepID=A0ABU7I8E5_9SPHI|nr:septal ring lytic transglycosylase RlpA family protein [Pedobacter sp. KR3-3]MEE1945637.1 septal ring lytic transglycosylase RlpA family protein [Pedobacter sp. KR3-3]